MNQVLIAVSLALLASSALLPVSDGVKKPLSTPREEDVPYIKCQVCEKLASRLYQLVKEKQVQISPKKISEYEIIEIIENVCNLKKEEADWILKIDLVEKGDKFELVEQEEEGMCNSECKTIETACQKVIGYSDTDVAEYIYKSKPDLVSLVNHLCKDLTDACSKKPPPVPKDRVPGEPFAAKSSKDAEMDKILRSMQGTPGAPGMKVYSREDIEKYKDNPGKFGNEDEEDLRRKKTELFGAKPSVLYVLHYLRLKTWLRYHDKDPERIKFEETRSLIGVQELSRTDLKIKGVNVG